MGQWRENKFYIRHRRNENETQMYTFAECQSQSADFELYLNVKDSFEIALKTRAITHIHMMCIVHHTEWSEWEKHEKGILFLHISFSFKENNELHSIYVCREGKKLNFFLSSFLS